jgi:hypothetical protein
LPRKIDRRTILTTRRFVIIVSIVVVVVAASAAYALAPRLSGGPSVASTSAASLAPAAPAAGGPSVSSSASPSTSPLPPAPSPTATKTAASTTHPAATATPKPKATARATARPTAKPTAATAAAAPPKPAIIADFITFGAKRRAETIAYNRRHAGQATVALTPRVIVLHYTAGGTAAGAHALFNADTPNVGELPGVVAHFVIAKNGAIYQELPLNVRGRHTIGLNQVAIGIEFVQDGGSGSAWATAQIFARHAQITAGLKLVRWLQWRYGIAARNVIGHGTANSSPYFKDLAGWRNTHTDWGAREIARFRALLAP